MKLDLGNVIVVNSRAEQFKPPSRFDSVMARALGKLNEFVRVAGHLVAREGWLLASEGASAPQAEIEALPKSWEVVAIHRLTVPGLDAQRHLAELQPQSGRGARPARALAIGPVSLLGSRLPPMNSALSQSPTRRAASARRRRPSTWLLR